MNCISHNRFGLAIVACLFSLSLWAEVPAGYYDAAVGKSGEELQKSLSTIINNATDVGYNGLWEVYKTTDRRPDGKVWDMYSDATDFIFEKDQCGNYSSEGDCYNREHSVPKSWFNNASPMYSDAWHVYPTDGKVNGQRSNYPFGECSGGTSLGGKALGRLGNCTFPGYSGKVFEPDDEYKGDFARTYFYFVTRYEDQMSSFNGESFAKNTYPSLSQWSIDLFLKWHREDPVSQKEIDRNDAVYGFQRNRNPFIDHPELAEYIWGNKKGQPWGLTSALEDGGINECFHLRNSVVYDQQLDIDLQESIEVDYAIYNMMGVLMESGKLVGPSTLEVDYPAGVYIMRAKAADSETAVRFIVK